MNAQLNAKLRHILLAMGLTAGLAAQPVWAEEPEEAGTLHLTAKSITTISRDVVPGALNTTEQQIPTMQILNLRGENIGGSGMFAYGSGFAAQQIASGSLPPARAADLAYGYLGWEGQTAKTRIRVQLGRQFVFSGATPYVFMDGASVIAYLPAKLRLDAYGGSAAFSSFDHVFDAPVVGGRLAWSASPTGHIAASIQDISGSTEATRRTVGADFAWRPNALRISGENLAITGQYAYDLLGRGLQDARIDVSGRLLRDWLGVFVRAEVRDPLAYLPRNSIFTAFVQRTDGLVGGGVDLKTPGALYGSASYDRYVIGDGLLAGYRAQLNLGLRLDALSRYRAGFTYNRMFNGDNGYDQYRIWCRGALWQVRKTVGSREVVEDKLTAALDLDSYFFISPVRGVSESLMATAAVRYAPTRGLTAGLDGQIWSNPYFTSQAMALVSLTITDALFRPAPAAPPPPPKKDDEDEGRSAYPTTPGLAANDRPLMRGAL